MNDVFYDYYSKFVPCQPIAFWNGAFYPHYCNVLINNLNHICDKAVMIYQTSTSARHKKCYSFVHLSFYVGNISCFPSKFKRGLCKKHYSRVSQRPTKKEHALSQANFPSTIGILGMWFVHYMTGDNWMFYAIPYSSLVSEIADHPDIAWYWHGVIHCLRNVSNLEILKHHDYFSNSTIF